MTKEGSSQFDRLAEPVKRWIWSQGWTALRDIQEQAIPAVLDGGDVILAARTAAGKTEAAFLPLISRILTRHDQTTPGFAALYVSPLKALINDQFRRLESLLEGCEIPLHRWHGDVSTSARQRAIERPAGIVLITPESLEATLVRRGRQAKRLFSQLDAVVIDELHAFIGTERGRQLQSILNRIEVATGRQRIDRIGLSATLGDMDLAKEELRPGYSASVNCIESKEASQEIRLQVRGYRKERPKLSEAATALQPASADDAIAKHMFDVLRGKRNLVFGGSRRNVEIYTDLLREMAEAQRLPNEFFAHHGNLAKSEREAVEERLRDDPRPTTAIATSTLELGIDIGDVESVAQIGPGWAVSSLRQRLGRSGRRAGSPAVLRMYVAEDEYHGGLHPSDRLRLDLVQATAMVELLLNKWCEPPRSSGLHLSTLSHQILAVICQFGAVQPESAWRLLCERGPFRAVDRQLFADVLKALARPDAAIIEMGPKRELMLGKVGERIAAGYDFYAVFSTTQEFRIVADGKTLGTIPVDQTLAPGQTIIFNGRRWRILTVDSLARMLEVRPSTAALPPKFGGGFGAFHDRIAERMREVLGRTDIPAFLSATGRELLDEGRSAYFELGLDRRAFFESENSCLIFPWVGSIKLDTLSLALVDRGLDASASGHAIEVDNCSASNLLLILQEMASAPPPQASDLVKHVAEIYREKFDIYLTDELLRLAHSVERLEATAVPTIARRVLEAQD